jgi:hypothetical protein
MDTSNTYQMDLADEEDDNDMDWDVKCRHVNLGQRGGEATHVVL